MILGFLISNSNKFVVFEHYFENFSQFVPDKAEFFSVMDNLTCNAEDFKFNNVNIKSIRLEKGNWLSIVHLVNKSIKPEHLDTMIKIGEKVLVANKEMTHEVLKSKYASDLLN